MKTTRVTALAYAALLCMVGSSVCSAAPKVSIRIVSRSTPDADAASSGPVPFREPMVFYHGPFVSDLYSLECLKENPVSIRTEAALVDFCHLRNVTYVAKKPELAEGSEDSTTSAEPATRKILGIFRGWQVDPITMRYKKMMFDDGDYCEDTGNRMRFVLELVPTKNKEATPRFYDFKQVDQCGFSAKLFVHVPSADLKPQEGIHTPGVLDITSAKETLPQVCGQMKCSYSTVSGKVRAVMTQVRQAQKLVAGMSSKETSTLANLTLSSSKSILQSSNTVLERSLELLETLEHLQLSLQEAIDATQKASESEKADAAAEDTAKEEIQSTADGSSGSDADSSQDDESSDESEAAEQQATAEEVVVQAEG